MFLIFLNLDFIKTNSPYCLSTFPSLGMTPCILSPSVASILSSSGKPQRHPNSCWMPTSKPTRPVVSPTELRCASGSCLFVAMVNIFVYTLYFSPLGLLSQSNGVPDYTLPYLYVTNPPELGTQNKGIVMKLKLDINYLSDTENYEKHYQALLKSHYMEILNDCSC